MIMMTKFRFRTSAIIRLLIVIPLSAVLIIAIPSCSAGKKAAKTQKENVPPPPPPPPPPPATKAPEQAPKEVFTVVEEMPYYPGGDEALIKFIAANVIYPKTAKDKNITGRVIVRFIVDTDGNAKDPVVLRSVDPDLDAEAVRVIGLLSKWKPGLQGGKAVNVYYSIPISFNLAPPGRMNNFQRFIVSGNDTIYLRAQESPEFKGGNEAVAKFKSENLKYPDAAKSNKMSGTVMVQFVVNKNGSLSDFAITTGICPSLDAEGLRVAKLMPYWLPGKENGKAVKAISSMFFAFNGNSPQEVQDEVFVVVEEMPLFPGGDSTLMKFISSNIQYPKNAKEKNIQGRVILRFCVTYEGKINRVGVLKAVDPELDMEAVRVIKMLPEWKPGKQGGKPVNVWYSVPITFKLDGGPANMSNKPVEKPVAPMQMSMPTGYDEPPVFKGGETALIKFIAENIIYPPAVREKGIMGTVVISYSISEKGVVENANIRESADPLLDAEALRVVKLIPAWEPAKFKGVPVKVSYSVPVTFSLK
jgi:TonB family protein